MKKLLVEIEIDDELCFGITDHKSAIIMNISLYDENGCYFGNLHSMKSVSGRCPCGREIGFGCCAVHGRISNGEKSK